LQTEKSAVTTNCKKSAEVIIPAFYMQGRTEQFKVKWTLVCKYIGSTNTSSKGRNHANGLQVVGLICTKAKKGKETIYVATDG